MTAQAAATAVLAELADPAIVDAAARLVADGRAEWCWDPEVADVVGLLHPGTNRAWLVVYLDDQDFETSDELEGEL